MINDMDTFKTVLDAYDNVTIDKTIGVRSEIAHISKYFYVVISREL